MAPDAFAPMVLFAVVACVTPGGATTIATASGARFGFRRSVPLMAAPALQLAMKIAGSAYLVWLAWKIGRSGPPNLDRDLARPTSFVGGAGLLLLNPKGWTMALGAAASFAMLARDPVELAMVLGATLGLASAASLVLWCLAGALLARLLRTERQWRLVNAALGLLLALSVAPMWLK
jgi:threonine/homoserine/homoserine lactone efflux protein